MREPMRAAGVIVIKNNLILGFQRTDGNIGLPFGKINQNETPQECAIRELFEETGVKAIVLDQPFEKDGCYTFLAISYDDTNMACMSPREGYPVWLRPDEFFVGLYEQYNRAVFDYFGIK